MSIDTIGMSTRGILEDNGFSVLGRWSLDGIWISNIIGWTLPAKTRINLYSSGNQLIDITCTFDKTVTLNDYNSPTESLIELDTKARQVIDFGIVPSFRRSRFV
jgi:hypothetical protein